MTIADRDLRTTRTIVAVTRTATTTSLAPVPEHLGGEPRALAG